MLLVHGIALAIVGKINAPTIDEVPHLVSGLTHIETGNFDLYRVNPPLVRTVAAIPAYVMGIRASIRRLPSGIFERQEFIAARQFSRRTGGRIFSLVTFGRWMLIPLCLIGPWVAFRWATELYGQASGLIACLLWCASPNMIAWGGTISADVVAAGFGLLATYSFWHWLKKNNVERALVAGMCMGLALLTKSTWVILFAVWPLLFVLWRWTMLSSNLSSPRLWQLSVIILTGAYVLNVGYGFEGSFTPVKDFEFISKALSGSVGEQQSGNCFADSWISHFPVPLPMNYVRGIDVQKYDFEQLKWSSLRGEAKKGGWWYYYLYALAVKTPVGTLALFALAVGLTCRMRQYSMDLRDEAVLLLPAACVVFLVSSQTGFSRYLRYILPALPFLFVFAARVGKAIDLRHSVIAKIVCACVVAASVSSLTTFPHSLSYFNELVAGPLRGGHHLLDSNIDGGQDLLYLQRWLNSHPEASPLGLKYFGGITESAVLNGDFVVVPSSTDGDMPVLAPGWYAVSVNYVMGYRYYDSDKPRFVYFQNLNPVARAGYSINIYKLPDNDNER